MLAAAVLTRSQILDVAEQLISEGGGSALTMRSLGQRLGVTATALYHHFEGRDAIADAVADRLSVAVVDALPPDGSWDNRLRVVLADWHRSVVARPEVAAWLALDYGLRPPVLRLHEAVLRVLAEGGFAPRQAVRLKGAVMRYCLGHVLLRESPSAAAMVFDPVEFAHLRKARRYDEAASRQAQFEFGLDSLLRGVELDG